MKASVKTLCLIASIVMASSAAAQSRSTGELANGFGLNYEIEDFSGGFETWKQLEAELKHQFPIGGVTLRWNGAERFGDRGHQFEVDAYPSLGKGTYVYLNAGRSNTSFFPRWRYGAEVFRSLPHSFEMSVGARRLDFQSSKITLYTGSVGRYIGNNWVSFRPYVSHDEAGSSISGSIQARHYYSTGDDYVGASVSYGEAPEENVVLQEIDRLKSTNVRGFIKRKVTKRLILSGTIGWRDLEFRAGSHRRSIVAAAGFETRF